VKAEHTYPFELSGGLRQRAMIAMALVCRPALLIADEPTTALDVTIQAQILQLIKELQAEFGMALVMITHDLGVIAETVDRVVVMYGGRVMEHGSVQQIFDAPTHSYTQSLLQSLRAGETRQERDSSEIAVPALELRGLSKTYQVKRRGRIFHSEIDVHAVRSRATASSGSLASRVPARARPGCWRCGWSIRPAVRCSSTAMTSAGSIQHR
jgi:ABC-type dipeptide/oligopeptide/nickel transport system ATPase component